MTTRSLLMTRDDGDLITGKVVTRLKEIRDRGLLRREATVGAIDEAARTVELSFSSEVEYQRWFGIEVLGHGAGEVRLDRLNNDAAVLWMHNWNDQRGVVVTGSARIESDAKGRCVVRFSKSAEGEKLFQDVLDGIVTKVSVGYMVHGLKLVEERDGVDVYRVTDWEPYEVSLVSVPADDTVGIGRAAEIPPEEKKPAPAENDTTVRTNAGPDQLSLKGNSNMEKIVRDAAGNLVRAKVDENGNIIQVLEMIERAGEAAQAHVARGAEGERSRVRTISELGEQYGQREMALDFIKEGKTPEEFQRALLDKLNERGNKPAAETPSPTLGLTDAEVRNFSVFRAVRALLPGASQETRDAAAFEFECSRAAETRYGREARGILIPQDVLDRAFNAGGAANSPSGSTSGANLVATTMLAGSFVEMLRKRTAIMRLAQTMGGLIGNVEVPKQTAGATAYWIGEGGDATEGVPTIGQLALTPKTVAAYTDISRKLLMQSTPDAEGIVRRDLINAVAQAVDYAGYYGTGADNQPKGIKNYSGINGVDFAAANPTYAEIVKMESEIAADNADVDSMAYVVNALMRGALKTTQKFEDTNGAPVWEPGNTVNGYRTEVTNQLANGDVFFGNFSDLIVGLWGGLDLTVDPYSLSKSGGTRIVVFQDTDFVLRRTESFCWGSQNVA